MAFIRLLPPNRGFSLRERFKAFADQSDLQDLKVAVITVAGVVREDKKFVISNIISFLEHLSEGGESKDDWLIKEAKNLKWNATVNRDSPGLLVCDRVFKVNLTGTQEKVAVVLMVVEGFLGTKSPDGRLKGMLTSAIAALSTSLLMYNVYLNSHNNLKSRWDIADIDNDDRFTRIASLCPNLVIFCRDWVEMKGSPFGWVCGNQTQKRRRVYLMPPSDSTSDYTTSINAKRSLPTKYRDEVFLEHFRNFIEQTIVDANGLSLRITQEDDKASPQTFGRFCSRIMAHIECYSRIYGRQISVKKGIVKIYNYGVLIEALNVYTTGMQRMFLTPETFVQWDVFNTGHRFNKKAAKNQFRAVYKMGGKLLIKKLQSRLAKQISRMYKELRHINQMNEYQTRLDARQICAIQ